MNEPLLESTLPNRTYRGKVRDTYDLGDQMLIVATDRISAADVILPTGIPRKGEILTRLSAWWFDRIKEVVPNHFVALITAENAHLVPFLQKSQGLADHFAGCLVQAALNLVVHESFELWSERDVHRNVTS